jgi:hypothetical protein
LLLASLPNLVEDPKKVLDSLTRVPLSDGGTDCNQLVVFINSVAALAIEGRPWARISTSTKKDKNEKSLSRLLRGYYWGWPLWAFFSGILAGIGHRNTGIRRTDVILGKANAEGNVPAIKPGRFTHR